MYHYFISHKQALSKLIGDRIWNEVAMVRVLFGLYKHFKFHLFFFFEK